MIMKILRRFVWIILFTVIVLCVPNCVVANTISNPQIVEDIDMKAGQKVTWDCIWFGSYPQSEVIPSSLKDIYYAAMAGREGDFIVSDE